MKVRVAIKFRFWFEAFDAGRQFVMDALAETGREIAARQPRDRVIPLRKSDIIDGLIAEGRLDEADQARFRQLARMLGAILHYEYLEELDRLRETYFYFDPEIDPHEFGSAKDLSAAYRRIERRIRPRIDRRQLHRGLA